MNGVQPLRYLSRWVTPRALRVLTKASTCESCGQASFVRLCPDCRDKASPYRDNDPYDIVGGEGGGWT
jgi:hypothetical protein